MRVKNSENAIIPVFDRVQSLLLTGKCDGITFLINEDPTHKITLRRPQTHTELHFPLSTCYTVDRGADLSTPAEDTKVALWTESVIRLTRTPQLADTNSYLLESSSVINSSSTGEKKRDFYREEEEVGKGIPLDLAIASRTVLCLERFP